MGNHLKEARIQAGMTQAQASEASGIALGTLRRWEQGVNEPDIAAIILLADLYRTTTDDLLGSKFASYRQTSKSGPAGVVDSEGVGIDRTFAEITALYQQMDNPSRQTLHDLAVSLVAHQQSR